jgi:hypothetical protein
MQKAKIPAPFQRPSIDLSAPKEWREVEWGTLEVGDLIAEKGVVVRVMYRDKNYSQLSVGLPDSKTVSAASDFLVKAFVPAHIG